jgi:hypothetical protein
MEALGRKAAGDIDKLWRIAARLNGFMDEEDEGELGN